VNALMRAVTTQPMQNKCTCAAAWCRPACKQRSAAHDDTNTIRAFAAATVKRREPWAHAFKGCVGTRVYPREATERPVDRPDGSAAVHLAPQRTQQHL
jgi:hypothetical protein